MWNPFTGHMEQYYPASVGARALTYNDQDGAACIQVEIFFSPGCVVDGVKYATVADTPLVGFEDLLVWADSLGIPRQWPMGAPQWQGNARDVGIWNGNGGHYGHCNSPGDTHTDPGPMPALTGTITAQGSITQEDDLTPEQAAQLAYIAGPQFKADIFTGNSPVEQGARHAFHVDALNTEVPWMGFDGQTQPAGQRNTTTQALALGWSDAIATSQARLTSSVKESLTAGAVDVQALAAQLAPLLSTQQAHQFIVALGAALPKE